METTSQPVKIYNLVTMSQEYVDAWTRSYEENRLFMLMSEPEREVAKKNRKDRGYDRHLNIGRSYRGTFLSKEDVFKVIEERGGELHECYYTYLLIEVCYANEVDSWDREEYWFELDEDWEDYRPIDKPECFSKIGGFS